MSLTSEKLTWVITKDGMNQLRNVLKDPRTKLYLNKFKFGDSNGTYYLPTGREKDIVNLVYDSTNNPAIFPIRSKELGKTKMADESGNIIQDEEGNDILFDTVELGTSIPESIGGIIFNEIGIFGTYYYTDEDGNEKSQEYLFAISTFSNIPKYEFEKNYVSSMEYTASFVSSNLLAVYDSIVIEQQNKFITIEELEELTNNILYAVGNMGEQINKNTHILGLNRATQLRERLDKDKEAMADYASIMCANTFKNTIGYTKIPHFWFFQNAGFNNRSQCLPDYGYTGYNLSLNKELFKYDVGYTGIAHNINLTNKDYFVVEGGTGFNLTAPFTLAYALEFNKVRETNTLLAQDGVFEFKKEYDEENDAIRFAFRMFGANNSSIVAETPWWTAEGVDTLTSIMLSYNGSVINPKFNFFLNLSCLEIDFITASELIDEPYMEGEVTITGTWNGMNTSTKPIASYSIKNSNIVETINAKVTLFGKLDNTFLEKDSQVAKNLALTLVSLIGGNSCLIS